MTRLSCRAVRATLEALHDDELPISAQVDVEAHLLQCPDCAARRDELMSIQALLRSASSRPDMVGPDDGTLGASMAPVVNGAMAELSRRVVGSPRTHLQGIAARLDSKRRACGHLGVGGRPGGDPHGADADRFAVSRECFYRFSHHRGPTRTLSLSREGSPFRRCRSTPVCSPS